MSSKAEQSSKFIVTFKPETPKDVVDKAAADVEKQGGKVFHRYDTVLNGFAAHIPDNILTTLQSHDQLDYIEPDGPVSMYASNIVNAKKQ
ncbi:hypothetical protein BKA69DRAFT_1127954 [Paraphysoderma sedebokerense]|nr:hypothetical protein BKA69DRAFT_1127954 [Paraphysoderma sedebokerense]